MERKLAVVTDDGVPGVGPALKADDHIGRLGQEIGDLPLASSPQFAPTIALTIIRSSCRGDSRIGLFPRATPMGILSPWRFLL